MKRHSLNFLAMIVVTTLLGAEICNAQGSAADVAITHAKIFTLAGPPIEDGTVVIHDGKIAAVGAGAAIPAGAQVIDAKGVCTHAERVRNALRRHPIGRCPEQCVCTSLPCTEWSTT